MSYRARGWPAEILRREAMAKSEFILKHLKSKSFASGLDQETRKKKAEQQYAKWQQETEDMKRAHRREQDAKDAEQRCLIQVQQAQTNFQVARSRGDAEVAQARAEIALKEARDDYERARQETSARTEAYVRKKNSDTNREINDILNDIEERKAKANLRITRIDEETQKVKADGRKIGTFTQQQTQVSGAISNMYQMQMLKMFGNLANDMNQKGDERISMMPNSFPMAPGQGQHPYAMSHLQVTHAYPMHGQNFMPAGMGMGMGQNMQMAQLQRQNMGYAKPPPPMPYNGYPMPMNNQPMMNPNPMMNAPTQLYNMNAPTPAPPMNMVPRQMMQTPQQMMRNAPTPTTPTQATSPQMQQNGQQPMQPQMMPMTPTQRQQFQQMMVMGQGQINQQGNQPQTGNPELGQY